MAKILRTAAADEDLLLIAEYGAGRWGVDAAISFVRTFEDAFDLLEQHPDAGRSRGELGEGIRSWLHRGYVVYYVHVGDEVVIGRILHGAADPVARFDPREPWSQSQ